MEQSKNCMETNGMLRAFYQAGANVVVIFLPQVIFVFLLFLGMVLYAN